MVKTHATNNKSRKNRLLDILNSIKQVVDNPTTQKDIKLLYEDILIKEADLITHISLFKRGLLQSSNDVVYNYNISQLKRLMSYFEYEISK